MNPGDTQAGPQSHFWNPATSRKILIKDLGAVTELASLSPALSSFLDDKRNSQDIWSLGKTFAVAVVFHVFEDLMDAFNLNLKAFIKSKLN